MPEDQARTGLVLDAEKVQLRAQAAMIAALRFLEASSRRTATLERM